MATTTRKRRKKKPVSAGSTTPARRRRRSLPAKSTRKRTTRRRRKGMGEGLAEAVDVTKSGSLGNSLVKAGLGGAAYLYVVPRDADRKTKGWTGLALTLTAAMLGQKGVAIGIFAATAFDYLAASPAGQMSEGDPVEVDYVVDRAMLSDGEPDYLDLTGMPILSQGAYPSYYPLPQ